MRPPKVDMVNEDLGKQQKVAIIHQVSRLWFLDLLLCSSRTVSHGGSFLGCSADLEVSALVGQQMLAAGLKVSLWLRRGTSP